MRFCRKKRGRAGVEPACFGKNNFQKVRETTECFGFTKNSELNQVSSIKVLEENETDRAGPPN